MKISISLLNMLNITETHLVNTTVPLDVNLPVQEAGEHSIIWENCLLKTVSWDF
jgi:hypothetical protein